MDRVERLEKLRHHLAEAWAVSVGLPGEDLASIELLSPGLAIMRDSTDRVLRRAKGTGNTEDRMRDLQGWSYRVVVVRDDAESR